MKFSLCISVLAASLLVVSGGRVAADGQKALRSSRLQTQSLVQALSFKYTLRLCNAYPTDKKLEVARGKDTLAKSLAYKECQDQDGQLKEGDKLEFRFDGSEAGTFSIGELPQNDATLLLMITRHDTQSTAVSFESHVFATLANSQVAVLDMYRGAAKGSVKIQDKKDAKHARSEDLRYDSVVAVNPGIYNVVLEDEGKQHAKSVLVAKAKESYVVFRVGVDGKDEYKQEIVVFPLEAEPKSGAAGASVTALLATLVFAALQ